MSSRSDQKRKATMCLVVDAQGFYVDNRFVVRELGRMDWKFQYGIERYRPHVKWDSLNRQDRRTVSVVHQRVHGLTFQALEQKEPTAKSQSEFTGDLEDLYKDSRVRGKEMVACKNDHILKALDIPCMDLHLWGCPLLPNHEEVACCLHRLGGLCALAKCCALWNWITLETQHLSFPKKE